MATIASDWLENWSFWLVGKLEIFENLFHNTHWMVLFQNCGQWMTLHFNQDGQQSFWLEIFWQSSSLEPLDKRKLNLHQKGFLGGPHPNLYPLTPSIFLPTRLLRGNSVTLMTCISGEQLQALWRLFYFVILSSLDLLYLYHVV